MYPFWYIFMWHETYFGKRFRFFIEYIVKKKCGVEWLLWQPTQRFGGLAISCCVWVRVVKREERSEHTYTHHNRHGEVVGSFRLSLFAKHDSLESQTNQLHLAIKTCVPHLTIRAHVHANTAKFPVIVVPTQTLHSIRSFFFKTQNYERPKLPMTRALNSKVTHHERGSETSTNFLVGTGNSLASIYIFRAHHTPQIATHAPTPLDNHASKHNLRLFFVWTFWYSQLEAIFSE